MRLNILTSLMILTGLLFSIYEARAVVIGSIDQPKDNFELHPKIVIYRNLSRYRNFSDQKSYTAQDMITKYYSDRYLLSENNQYPKPLFEHSRNQPVGRADRGNFNLGAAYIPDFSLQNGLIGTEDHDINAESAIVGSFLDGLKADPSFRKIYFTSKDLTFSYRMKVANILNLEFNMDQNDYKNHQGIWKRTPEETEMIITGKDKRNFQRQAGILFGIISESYKNIFYILLVLGITLYLCFRYFLNKYI